MISLAPSRRARLAAAALGTAVAVSAATGFTAAPSTASPKPAPHRCAAGFVGLTYDDGPTTGFTENLLSTLQKNGLQATLFNIGENAQTNSSLVRAEKKAEMPIGNHSWTHPHLPQMTHDEMLSELQRTQDALKRITGRAPKLFRPPFGETNETLRAVEKQLGLTEVLWDVDTQDWNGATTEQIVQRASTLQDGQVILMHDGYPTTIEAIPAIAANLRSRGMCAGEISPTTGRAGPPDRSVSP
ncbi:polysaccharide deacetylase family protein [Actinomadura decatromicini]|uniref:Polysaccharide deacetylase family protein n=1 Tax=Actinomadura decatromicini TaxID=2604572 RepID=A0A5D3F3Y8_9ACTN|nr:polysaccharide deacetylase family protein [Actinomadura decatromicini]TYK42694.1 polysaccharide deacetylase family protein [Actinomadura decatromicini]